MAISIRPRQPYNYESPEQKARDVLRSQKVIAGVTTRANEHAQSIAALQALAKATGVPMKELPAGGIHSAMSPTDVQAATDRINRWVAAQPKAGGKGIAPMAGPYEDTRTPGRVYNPDGSINPALTLQRGGAQGPTGANAPAAAAIAGALGVPASPVTPTTTAPQTRTTPTGGTETLVQSESGPRWVASVANAPAANNQNGQVTRDPGGQTRQVQLNPAFQFRDPSGRTAPATAAQNQAAYATTTVPVPKPWTPPDSPEVVTSPQDAARIAYQYGDKTGGFVTNGPSAPGVPGYTGTGAGAPPYIPPAVSARVAQDIATPPKPVPPATPINPLTGSPIDRNNPIPGLPATPPNPTSSAPVNPVTSPSKAGAMAQPMTPDEEEEQRKRRLAQQTPPASPTPTPQPYTF